MTKWWEDDSNMLKMSVSRYSENQIIGESKIRKFYPNLKPILISKNTANMFYRVTIILYFTNFKFLIYHHLIDH